MSFVYAFKADDSICMIGDTKVTIDDKKGGKPFGNRRRLVEEYGILKTIILSYNIALGFASNNLKDVDDALEFIFNKATTFENILNILVDSSKKHNGASEYILTYKNEHIFLIKNGVAEERVNCYIGSHKFFTELQKQRNNRPISHDTIPILVSTLIKSNVDKNVGGFCIQLKYSDYKQKYIYVETFDSTVTKERFIPSGATLPLVDSAEDGGFTYQTFPFYNEGIIQYLAIQIIQINKTYAYVPLLITPPYDCEFKYLFLPFDISDKIKFE